MNYKVSFSGQENGTLHRFEMNRDNDSIRLSVDDAMVKEMEITEIEKLFKKYDLDVETHYRDRELTRMILTESYPPLVYDLFRSFAACHVRLYYTFATNISEEGRFVELIDTSFKSGYYNSLLIENVNVDNGQPIRKPAMYFIKEKYKENETDIVKFYEMGLLHKIEIKAGEKRLSNYYLSFESPNSTDLDMPDVVMVIWERIKQDMQKASESRWG
jgi:hypothetical protein